MSLSGQLVSVVMPVLNARPYLDDSIGSILEQTHRALELVIRDDGSTDGSTEALRRWARRDARIRLYVGGESLGPAGSSDWVVRHSRASFVARMDADDLSRPDRLERELEVLASEPDVVLVGSLHEAIDASGRRVRGPDLWRLAGDALVPPFAHGAVMFRREAYDRVGGYRRSCEFWEDLDLFLRLAAVGRALVIPEPLYRYRFTGTSARSTAEHARVARALELMRRCLEVRAQRRSYEALVASPAGGEAPQRIPLEAIMALGSLRLWSGGSPGTLGPLLRQGALRWNRHSVRALGWSVLGAVSPRLLRCLGRTIQRMRNLRARRRFPSGATWEWRPRPIEARG